MIAIQEYMNNILGGIIGFFISLTSLFHGVNGVAASTHSPIKSPPQVNISTNSSTSADKRDIVNYDQRKNLPAGEKPFFGTIESINGSTLTIRTQFRGRTNLQITPRVPKSLTVNLDTSTQYIGGTQSTLQINTKIAGIGKINSDDSITAIKITINPRQMVRF